MKECEDNKKDIGLKLFEMAEAINHEKQWIDLASCYCENNPENEESPSKIILLLDEIAKTNNKLIVLNEEIIEDLSKL